MKTSVLAQLLKREGIVELVRGLGGKIRIDSADGSTLLNLDAWGEDSADIMLGKRLIGRVIGHNPGPVADLLRALAHECEQSAVSRREELEFREVILALSSELNLDRLLTRIMEATSLLLQAERSTLFLHDESTDELWSPVALGVQGGEIRIPSDAGIAGSVFRSGENIQIPDAYADSRFNPKTDRATGYHTQNILCCPVVNKEGKIIGVTQALNKVGGPFTDQDAERLTTFSAQASIAIENAKLYHNMEELVRERTHDLNKALNSLQAELDAAAEYVVRLLPPVAVHGPLSCDWRYVPCDALGGDAFGYHWLDDEHFAIYLNDVSGHGVGAALLSVSVMNVLQAQMLQGVDYRQPDQLLAALNDAFPMDRHNNMFFTMWYGVYNRRTRTLTYASAGHPPAFLISERDGLERLWTHNMLLGGLPEQKYETGEVKIDKACRLLVFSDGVYEVQCEDGRMWALDEFADFMAGKPGKPTTMDDLMVETQRLAGREGWDDDFSILEVAFTPE